jgi:hypothetical protein
LLTVYIQIKYVDVNRCISIFKCTEMENDFFQMSSSIVVFILTLIPSALSSLIEVRESVNVTMTCQFDSRATLSSWHSVPILPAINTSVLSRSSDHIILWYKDEAQVIGVNSISNDPKKYQIEQLDRHAYRLTVLNVQLESAGNYKCQNFTAKDEKRFRLNVIGKR